MNKSRKKSSGRKEVVAVAPSKLSLAVGEVVVDVGAEFRELIVTGGLAIAAALFREERRRRRAEEEAPLDGSTKPERVAA